MAAKKTAKKTGLAPAPKVPEKRVLQVTINEENDDPVYLVNVEGIDDTSRKDQAVAKALARFRADNPNSALQTIRVDMPDSDISAIIS